MWARIAWAGLGGIPALLLASLLVVTPRERIISLCHDLVVLVDEGDVAAIGQQLADDFDAGGYGRTESLTRLERTLARYQVDNAQLTYPEVDFPHRDEGVAVFNAACRVHSEDVYFERLLSRWRVTFRHRGGRWLVTRIEAIPTAFSPISDVRDCLR